ncbi:MAG: hypothetical protein B7Z22_04875 [Hyphomonas sp. 32-62-5]|nr:MAG: hypothetical protein B7Z22_04875 [Hyphomonas sp. 32-62-5]
MVQLSEHVASGLMTTRRARPWKCKITLDRSVSLSVSALLRKTIVLSREKRQAGRQNNAEDFSH